MKPFVVMVLERISHPGLAEESTAFPIKGTTVDMSGCNGSGYPTSHTRIPSTSTMSGAPKLNRGTTAGENRVNV